MMKASPRADNDQSRTRPTRTTADSSSDRTNASVDARTSASSSIRSVMLRRAALDAAADPLAKGDRRSPAQRNADALGDIARHFLATADAARAGGAHTQVLLAGGRLAWVGDIAESTAARVACDAQVTLVGVDTDGEARDLFTRRRYFTWTQRKAIIVRDGNQCPWPWCQRPIAWSDGHHLRPWQDGGPTTVANGALPCEGHHLLLHEGGWTLERLKDGRYLARDRHGRVIGPEPTRRPRGMRPPPRRRE